MYHGGSRTSRWKKMLDVKTSWCLSNKGVSHSKASAICRYWVKETRCPVRHGWSVVDDSWTSRWKKMLDVKTSWCLSNKGVSQSKASAIGRYWVKETRCPVRHGWSVVDDSWCG
ncbi:hypothetical protein IscW_ISCW001138 [Ixodes scapularis]|uniref:Uncharacterized protein n=1 Tax=Ixodes scapularis TaxID=6945 RepID=B7P4L3_IXOSC|nr:hypothetical protein IscW_ISCW001138 [Ixodes scapularis]|eukprot:XP_002406213.1 hypothetical protein IscW_ISCW001138 [Ixodes scapularis]